MYSNCTADQRLCFRSVIVQAGFYRARSETQIVGYLLQRLIILSMFDLQSYTYNAREGERLIDHAFKNGDPEILCRLLYRLAKRIQRFHDNGWIARCFSAKDVWVTEKGKVIYITL